MAKINPFKLSTEDIQEEVKAVTESHKHDKVTHEEPKKTGIEGMFAKKEKEKKVITTIYIPETLSQKLHKVAKDNDISVNEVVNTILEKTL